MPKSIEDINSELLRVYGEVEADINSADKREKDKWAKEWELAKLYFKMNPSAHEVNQNDYSGLSHRFVQVRYEGELKIYAVGTLLGEGGFGSVHNCYDEEGNEEAIKFQRIVKYDSALVKNFVKDANEEHEKQLGLHEVAKEFREILDKQQKVFAKKFTARLLKKGLIQEDDSNEVEVFFSSTLKTDAAENLDTDTKISPALKKLSADQKENLKKEIRSMLKELRKKQDQLLNSLLNTVTEKAQIEQLKKEYRKLKKVKAAKGFAYLEASGSGEVVIVQKKYARSLRDALDDIRIENIPENEKEIKILRLFSSALEALNAAHKKGIIHADIKQDNFMLDTAGNVYLIDFGISQNLERTLLGRKKQKKISQKERFKDTEEYTGPELARKKKQESESPKDYPRIFSTKSDIFSFGTMMEHTFFPLKSREISGIVDSYFSKLLESSSEEDIKLYKKYKENKQFAAAIILHYCLAHKLNEKTLHRILENFISNKENLEGDFAVSFRNHIIHYLKTNENIKNRKPFVLYEECSEDIKKSIVLLKGIKDTEENRKGKYYAEAQQKLTDEMEKKHADFMQKNPVGQLIDQMRNDDPDQRPITSKAKESIDERIGTLSASLLEKTPEIEMEDDELTVSEDATEDETDYLREPEDEDSVLAESKEGSESVYEMEVDVGEEEGMAAKDDYVHDESVAPSAEEINPADATLTIGLFKALAENSTALAENPVLQNTYNRLLELEQNTPVGIFFKEIYGLIFHYDDLWVNAKGADEDEVYENRRKAKKFEAISEALTKFFSPFGIPYPDSFNNIEALITPYLANNFEKQCALYLLCYVEASPEKFKSSTFVHYERDPTKQNIDFILEKLREINFLPAYTPLVPELMSAIPKTICEGAILGDLECRSQFITGYLTSMINRLTSHNSIPFTFPAGIDENTIEKWIKELHSNGHSIRFAKVFIESSLDAFKILENDPTLRAVRSKNAELAKILSEDAKIQHAFDQLLSNSINEAEKKELIANTKRYISSPDYEDKFLPTLEIVEDMVKRSHAAQKIIKEKESSHRERQQVSLIRDLAKAHHDERSFNPFKKKQKLTALISVLKDFKAEDLNYESSTARYKDIKKALNKTNFSSLSPLQWLQIRMLKRSNPEIHSLLDRKRQEDKLLKRAELIARKYPGSSVAQDIFNELKILRNTGQTVNLKQAAVNLCLRAQVDAEKHKQAIIELCSKKIGKDVKSAVDEALKKRAKKFQGLPVSDTRHRGSLILDRWHLSAKAPNAAASKEEKREGSHPPHPRGTRK